MIRRALLSVSNKQGIVELAKELQERGIELLSTGGTFSLLTKKKIAVKSIEEYTGFEEILSGRVKTLHPIIYGGILALRQDKTHQQDLKNKGIGYIDLVVVNLYPFVEAMKLGWQSSQESQKMIEMIEMIDIGGVSLLRSAAKNFKYTTVISNTEDYHNLILDIQKAGNTSLEKRLYLAKKAFQTTWQYDQNIHKYLEEYLEGIEKFTRKVTDKCYPKKVENKS